MIYKYMYYPQRHAGHTSDSNFTANIADFYMYPLILYLHETNLL